MDAPMLGEQEASELVEELAEALERMVDRCCLDMGPLWLDATRELRQNLEKYQISRMDFSCSPRYLALSKGARSRYRGLAAWRHAVLWQSVSGPDPEFQAAMETLYFQVYPENAPPYAWSSRASDAPGADRWPSATSLKHQAKEGCLQALLALKARKKELETTGEWNHELRALFLTPAVRDSLWDVLKLEDAEKT